MSYDLLTNSSLDIGIWYMVHFVQWQITYVRVITKLYIEKNACLILLFCILEKSLFILCRISVFQCPLIISEESRLTELLYEISKPRYLPSNNFPQSCSGRGDTL